MTKMRWKLRLGGRARAFRSLWRPQRFRVERLQHQVASDSPLARWLASATDRGLRYNPRWRSVEQRIERLFQRHPDRIAPQLAAQFMGGVDTFEFIHVTHRGGRFLSALAGRFRTPRVVEIGTAFGVSGMYMLCSIGNGHLWTFDPCEQWRTAAEQNLASLSLRFTRVGAAFETAFPPLAPQIAPIDVAFVDGLHTYQNMLQEFELLLPHMAPGGVLVFHDVELNDEMRSAWQKVKQHPRITCTAFVENQFGVCEVAVNSEQ